MREEECPLLRTWGIFPAKRIKNLFLFLKISNHLLLQGFMVGDENELGGKTLSYKANFWGRVEAQKNERKKMKAEKKQSTERDRKLTARWVEGAYVVQGLPWRSEDGNSWVWGGTRNIGMPVVGDPGFDSCSIRLVGGPRHNQVVS